MKKLVDFTLFKDEIVDEEETTTNDKGETVKITKKVNKRVPHKFFVAKPTRSLSDQANLYNSVMVSDGLRKGLMSVYSMDRKYREEGVFTDDDNKKYKELYDVLFKCTEELQKLAITPEDKRTKKQKEKWAELTAKITETRLQLKDFENIKSNLYTHSAEYRARNLTLTWWVLHLSYKEEDGKEVEFFPGKTLEDRLDYYDDLVEKNDSFINEAIERFMYTISFWFLNGADKAEDFQELDKLIKEEKEAKEKQLAEAVKPKDAPKEEVKLKEEIKTEAPKPKEEPVT